jgi:2-polyprenyl-3-methyl-5-hydroxy-6-metoxy-1,4-benzoquinol methylase
MAEANQSDLRKKVQGLAQESIRQNHPSAWFDTIYSEAQGDTSQVPWAKLTPHSALEDWLDRLEIDGKGKKAIVIGCGLGDDAEAIAARGYQVIAFDISPQAIAWCQQRFPNSPVTYQVADLFNLPPEWQQGFDFVLEIRNIQAFPQSFRTILIAKIASLVNPGGTLLLIDRFAPTLTEDIAGPPFALSGTDLAQFLTLGFQEVRQNLFDQGEDLVQIARVEYHRPTV